jgi:putative ABC transport system permease protein
MNLLIAWRNLAARPAQTALTALIVALGVAMAVFVVAVAGGLRRGIGDAGGPFELVVGPKGSATQLVVSSVLLQDVPVGNMPFAAYQRLAADPRVRDAIPIALGDNVDGLRLVGTLPELFAVQNSRGEPYYRLTAGRVFRLEAGASRGGEAVLGSAAAARLGLKVGDTFVSSHGVLESFEADHHDSFPFSVVGVLAPTDTPADLGIYVPLERYWAIHGLVAPGAGNDPGVTAVLVRASSISGAYQLYQELNARPDLQAALPGAVLTNFLDLVGQGQRLLRIVAGVAVVMAGLSVALTLYGALVARERETAVLRALGASRGTVLGVVLIEALLLGLLGLVGGLVLGYGAAAAAAALVRGQNGVAVRLAPEPVLIVIALVLLVVGLAAGVAPALRAYRVEPAEVLAG